MRQVLESAWTATWKIAVFFLIWAVLYAPAPFLLDLGSADAGGALAASQRLYLEAWGAAAIVVTAWISAVRIDRRSFGSLGFRRRAAVRDLLAGLALGSGMMALAVILSWLAGWGEFSSLAGVRAPTLALLGGAFLANAVTQEVLVRGYILQTIESSFDVRIAVVVSSLVFALLHAGAIVEGGLLPAINLFSAGVLLALAYTTTRHLWLPIGLHFAWNFIQGPVLGIAVSGQEIDGGWELLRLDGPPLLTGGDFGLEGGLVGTMVVAAGIAALLAVAKRRRGGERPGTTLAATASP